MEGASAIDYFTRRCLTGSSTHALCIAAAFHTAVRDFVLIICVAAPLFALTDYVDSCMTVAWRRWLTRHCVRTYFARRAFFRLKLDPQAIDNPDQVCACVPCLVTPPPPPTPLLCTLWPRLH